MIPYKDDNPSRTFPVVTIALIVVNLAVFIYYRLPGMRFFEAAVIHFGMIPFEFWHGRNLPLSPGLSPYLTLLTSMFMHGGLLHVAGNMLYLWIFGDNVEDFFGHFRFICFYLICGLVAAFTQLLFNPGSHLPMVGASGAIAGVLGAYLVLFPRARVHALVLVFFFVTTVTVPASLMLAFWFVLQVLSSLPATSVQAGGVAYYAHIGGFVMGYLWTRSRRRQRRISARWLS